LYFCFFLFDPDDRGYQHEIGARQRDMGEQTKAALRGAGCY